MSAAKTSYTDVAKFSKQITEHVDDIVTMKYEANSVSNSNLRWRITSPGTKSLLDSEVILVAKVKILPVNGAGRAVNIMPRKMRNWKSGMKQVGFVQANTGGHLVASTSNKVIGDTNAHYATGGAVVGENFGVAERFNGFAKSLNSVTVELNGAASISYRPDEWIHLSEMFLIEDGEDDFYPGGPRDSGSGGHFLGRAFKITSQDAREIELAEHGIDEGFARRCGIFRERCKPVDATETQTRTTAATGYIYTWVCRIPVAPLTNFRNGFGSARRSYLPYVSTLSIHMNFKPESQKFASMFQCTAVQGSMRFGANTIAGPDAGATAQAGHILSNSGTPVVDIGGAAEPVFGFHPNGKVVLADAALGNPFLICRWVNPKPSMVLAPSYTFSLGRWLTYKKDIAATNEYFTGKNPTGTVNQGPKWDDAPGYQVSFNNLRLEVLPDFFCLSCRPKQGSCTAAPNYSQFRTTRDDCSYAETMDCIYSGDEGEAVALTIQVQGKAGLCLTYTARDLYAILRKNAPNYKHSYETWKRGDRHVILLKPEDIPTPKMSGIFAPTVLNIKCRWVRGDKHRPMIGSADVHDLQNTNLIAGMTGAPCAGLVHEVSLSMFFEDSLSISQSSASTQAWLQEEGSVRGSSNQMGPAIDGLALN